MHHSLCSRIVLTKNDAKVLGLWFIPRFMQLWPEIVEQELYSQLYDHYYLTATKMKL